MKNNNNIGDTTTGGTNPAGSTTGTMGPAKWGALVGALVVIVGAGVYFGMGAESHSGKVLGADSNYQAVFLTNGQVYFGKLESSNSSLVLRDIYYLKVTQALQPAGDQENSAAQPNIQLVKLGSELHGPEDAMYLEKDKVLFWENMRDDSKVVEAIKKYQDTKK